jgi:hypothetical protein
LVLTAKQKSCKLYKPTPIVSHIKGKGKPIMARQLRTVRIGESVQLALHSIGKRDPWVVESTLISREGTGVEEVLTFHDTNDPRKALWTVNRFKGHWAWGSTGARVTVYEENPKPRKPRTVRPKGAPASTNNVSQITTAPKRRGRPRKDAAVQAKA